MHGQREVVEDISKIAKKYGVSYYQAENAIYARFEAAKEAKKKEDPFEGRFVNVRLYKFVMIYIPHIVRKKIANSFKRHLEKLNNK
jgi:hypothetical protein